MRHTLRAEHQVSRLLVNYWILSLLCLVYLKDPLLVLYVLFYMFNLSLKNIVDLIAWRYILFADDIKPFSCINKENGDRFLQRSLVNIIQCSLNGMSLNAWKCSDLLFGDVYINSLYWSHQLCIYLMVEIYFSQVPLLNLIAEQFYKYHLKLLKTIFLLRIDQNQKMKYMSRNCSEFSLRKDSYLCFHKIVILTAFKNVCLNNRWRSAILHWALYFKNLLQCKYNNPSCNNIQWYQLINNQLFCRLQLSHTIVLFPA